MKLSALLASRPTILRQAALAHSAAAWLTLHHASTRIRAAGLRGTVRLRQGDPASDETAPWATLTSDAIRPSVLEEHFTDNDLLALAEALAFATDTTHADVEFRIETLGETYAAPLRHSLEKAGVTLDLDPAAADPAVG